MPNLKTLASKDMANLSQDTSNSAISSHTADAKKSYITTHEAAGMLGVTVRTIQNWVDSGKLFAKVTLGGHRRLLRSEVEALKVQSMPRSNTSNKKNIPLKTSTFETALSDAPSATGPLRILVVEDNPTLMELYKFRFSFFNFPHTLLTAEDGLQGLFKIGRNYPQLVLMDLRMPNMDGFQMLRCLQYMPESADIKFIVITGLPAADILEFGGLPAGVALLPKPVPFDTLETLCMQRATELGLMGEMAVQTV
jgi:excisionase family DNA binding protein